jgi:hypothetical protein
MVSSGSCKPQDCGASDCSLELEWTLDSGPLASGGHTVLVTTTARSGASAGVQWSFTIPASAARSLQLFARSDAWPSPEGLGGGCASPLNRAGSSPAPTKIVNGAWGLGLESTYHYDGGSYEVNRCGPDGLLLVSQHVGPVAVPGGITRMLVWSHAVREPDGLLITSGVYGDPDDPRWRYEWKRNGGRAMARVLPPTTNTSSR